MADLERTHFRLVLLQPRRRIDVSGYRSPSPSVRDSPSASRDVAVAALAQAVAVALTQANRFGGVVTAQQRSQPGKAGGESEIITPSSSTSLTYKTV